MVGRLEGKVDSLLAAQAAAVGRHEGLEGRVGALERWRAYTIGISAAVAYAAASLSALIKH